MWWLIPLGINMIGAVFMIRSGIKIDKEKNACNKLSKEGTQSTLRYFYGVEEHEDKENKQ